MCRLILEGIFLFMVLEAESYREKLCYVWIVSVSIRRSDPNDDFYVFFEAFIDLTQESLLALWIITPQSPDLSSQLMV